MKEREDSVRSWREENSFCYVGDSFVEIAFLI